MSRPILCLDFDGVIHSYESGWTGIDQIPDKPVDGAMAFIAEAINHFEIAIFSTRNSAPSGIDAMKKWMRYHLWNYVHSLVYITDGHHTPMIEAIEACISYPTEKPSAFVGIDDRVLTFTGVFPGMETLKNFRAWNK